MKPKLRIAQLTNLKESVPPRHKSGLEYVVHYVTEELVKRGHDVTLFATADSETMAKLIPMWPKATSHDEYGQNISLETFATWVTAEAFKPEYEFDVIHSHLGMIANHFAGTIETPVVSTSHGPISYDFFDKFPKEYQQYFDMYEQKHFESSHRVVVSDYQASMLKQPATVIHNGLPLSEWPDVELKPGQYLAFLGYMSGNKGVHEAIQVAIQSNEKLEIAGGFDDHDSDSVEYFNSKVQPYLVNPHIKYHGPLYEDDKKSFLQHAKATLMPIQWHEPFGLVAIESLASGTPVIALNKGAMNEIIEDGKTGFVVNSIEEMIEATKSIDKLSRADCRKSVEDRFTVEKMVDAYEELYYKITS